MAEYRRLEKGEIVSEGDEYDDCVNPWNPWKDDAKWAPAGKNVGTVAPDPQFPAHRKFRRPLKADRRREFLDALTALLVEYDCEIELVAQWEGCVLEVNWGASHEVGDSDWSVLPSLLDGVRIELDGVE